MNSKGFLIVNIQPQGPTSSESSTPLEHVATRPLKKEETAVNELGQTLVHQVDVETTAVTVTQQLRAPTIEEKNHLEASRIASTALVSVRQESTPLPSVHDKWASPAFKSILEDAGGIENTMERILDAREKVAQVKEMYRSLQSEAPVTAMQTDVQALLTSATIKSVNGGKGGVYFLCDHLDKPKYVLKPGDEALLAINNGKKMASPFLDDDGICAPVSGVRIYEAVQNAELAYQAAEIFNLQHITPKTEVMIIEHPAFHDILDGAQEKRDPHAQALEKAMPTTKEKTCIVQPFMEGYWDMGSHLAAQANVEPIEIGRLFKEDYDAYQKLEEAHTPRDIDQSQYERITILAFIIGEKDGNAGNLMCSKTPPLAGKQRSLYKIDNAASFPDHNDGIRTGINWIAHNYMLELSQDAKEIIRNISDEKVEQLSKFMRERGKSEESITALRQRVAYLKDSAPEASTVADLDDAFENLWGST